MIQYVASELVLTHTHTHTHPLVTLNSGPSLPFMVHCIAERKGGVSVCVCVCADSALINNSTPYCF